MANSSYGGNRAPRWPVSCVCEHRVMHRIVMLALDGVIPFELGIPPRIFGGARGLDGTPFYEVLTCTVDGAPVRTDADFSITVEHGPEILESADTVIIPATHALGTASGE